MAGLPRHLRRHVVEQDYSQYNAVDHAVWRFILLQTYARLVQTAHPVYRDGLAATGLSVERIPRIEEMNEKLSRFGWGAVCVDGFIPPRAFQEFQACGVLPIAAEMRTRAHLVYTPAPDIVHEAAGHAPILPDPGYAAYLRRIGALGAEAFTSPAEHDVFQAIRALSEIKEDPSAAPEAIVAAEEALATANAAAATASEAARLSRLYWWTAEYGLVGRPDDYKIYGAGLLSSLGESHSCHAPSVRKLPLDVTCLDVAYDITRAQPQLFVTPSFAALHDVLDQAERTLAARRGGAAALATALASRELGSFCFEGGAWLVGTLGAVGPGGPAWLAFEGSLARAAGDPQTATIIARHEPADVRASQVLPIGRLTDGRSPAALTDASLEPLRDPATSRTRLSFASGAVLEGRVERCERAPDSTLVELTLRDARLTLPDRAPVEQALFRFWPLGDFVTARAGAIDPAFYPDVPHVPARVPVPRRFPPDEQRLLELYRQGEAIAFQRPDTMTTGFHQLHATAAAEFPHEWLIRWNMLESLRTRLPAGAAPPTELIGQLTSELAALEHHHDGREPIASGLAYLDGLPVRARNQ